MGASVALAGGPLTRNEVLARAKAGATAQAIVRESFPGGRLQKTAAGSIRVLIADQAPRVVMSGQTPLVLRDEGRRRAKAIAVPAGHRVSVTRTKSTFRVDDLDRPGHVRVMTGPVRLDSGQAETGIRMADPLDRRFHGTLRVLPSDGRRMMVVNETSIENYLQGVLPGDMPPEWGDTAPAALVAGAVAARSRALAARASSTRTSFHATSDDPLYLGLDGERPQTNAAVKSSEGWAITIAHQPFEASFPVVGGDVTIFTPDPGKPDQVASAPLTRVPGATPDMGGAAVQMAMSFQGTPYVWGGSKPGGFDCSGLLYYVYGRLGMSLPRVAEDQAKVGAPVPRGSLLPGDAVFFADSSGYIHHMGLYIGGGKMVHAPQTGDVVKVSDITTGYYASQYAGARRYSPAS